MNTALLVAWRKRLGLTQAQAADFLNVPLGTYRGWELGRFPVPGPVALLTQYIEKFGPI